ncbi:hypothetical protein [Streptomyces fuscichromogenes]|uniref:hypothetical protein n=1 Tax=Streptomyces fuscichromogenes TaxID=1324013 RepID=UPI001670394E|nr:hypothetical protein [Streptomyces fuscichromogenes]
MASGLVIAENYSFSLVDIAAPSQGNPTDRQPVPGSLVTLGTGSVLATFASAVETHEPYVDLECWPAEPPYGPGDDPWEVNARETLVVPAGRLTVISGVSGQEAAFKLTIPPGPYQMAVWCRGRADARAARGSYLYGVEHWLVRLWPPTGHRTDPIS